MLSLQETFTHKNKRWQRFINSYYEFWALSVDLGQRHDFTAITAMRHTRTPLVDEWDVDELKGTITQKVEQRFDVLGLQRLPLGMDYTLQGERIRQLLMAPPLNGNADLVIDDAGVGAPVGDLVVAHGRLLPVRVTLSGTATEVIRHAHRKYTVPKLRLVSHLNARLGSGELRFADDLSLKEVARDELTAFQQHVTASGKFTFEPRGSAHDDIVLSVGFGLWWCLEKQRHTTTVSTYTSYATGPWQDRLHPKRREA
jgi:hypothetical protein